MVSHQPQEEMFEDFSAEVDEDSRWVTFGKGDASLLLCIWPAGR
jgi:hypothetical protein